MTDAIAPIPTCADCGARESFAMLDGRPLCSPCIVLLTCARRVLAATAVQVPERSGWIHRDHAPRKDSSDA